MIKRNKYKIIIAILFIAYYYYPHSIESTGFSNKIWAHRVNSIEKLNSALNHFDGVELDLVYNNKKDLFDVNHPPSKSIGLTFEVYLNAIKKQQFPYLWLDLKNLSKENSISILNKLLYLFKSKNYPFHKILIESRQSNELLIFEKEGFKTSFYLPPNLNEKDRLSLSKSIFEIKTILNNQPNIAISTSFEDYNIIKNEFPNHKKYI